MIYIVDDNDAASVYRHSMSSAGVPAPGGKIDGCLRLIEEHLTAAIDAADDAGETLIAAMLTETHEIVSRRYAELRHRQRD